MKRQPKATPKEQWESLVKLVVACLQTLDEKDRKQMRHALHSVIDDEETGNLKVALRVQNTFEVGSEEWKFCGGLWNGMSTLRVEMKELKKRLEASSNTSADRRDTIVRLRRQLQLANERAKRRKVALKKAGVPVPEDPNDNV